MLNYFFRSRRDKATFFSYIDCIFPRQSGKILFVVKDRTYFSGNLRVVLEKYVKEGHSDIYLYKDGVCSKKIKKELLHLGVKVLDRFNLSSIWHILTSGTVILSHNPRDAHFSNKCIYRKIVNLWHGAAYKTIELTMKNIEKEKLKLLHNNSQQYSMIIASSEADKQTNIKAFGVPSEKVFITGLPRYEILKEEYILGEVLKSEYDNIMHIKGDKKLVLYTPTFRESNISPLQQITQNEWRLLGNFVEENNIIFAIRPHPYDLPNLPDFLFKMQQFIIVDNIEYTEPNILLKCADILIVDFSSIWIDYLLLKKPILGFAKDYYDYIANERNFVYKIEEVFPVPIINNVELLISEIEQALLLTESIEYKNSLKHFHQYTLDFAYQDEIYKQIEYLRNY